MKLYYKLLITIAFIANTTTAQKVDFSFQNKELPTEIRAQILVSQMTLDEKISQMVHASAAIPRLKVPDYNWWSEALHGVGTTADLEGEGVDAIASAHGGDKPDLKLPENQIKYIHQIIEKKKDKPLILVIASGGPVSLEGIEEHCDAILQIWYPGEQGGNAVADVLFGKVSPSGKLPITFPKNVDQLPPYNAYSMKGRTYKYMTKEPMFPFGYGLTYSKTEFSNLVLNSTKLKKKETLEVTVDVENVGNFDIEEVVQLYICPVNVSGGIPLKSIKGFCRTSIEKGETKSVSFSIKPEDLKVVNEEGEKVWRKGKYKIVVGNASPGELSINLGAAIPQEQIITLK